MCTEKYLSLWTIVSRQYIDRHNREVDAAHTDFNVGTGSGGGGGDGSNEMT